jgi:hypothetical protein
MTVDARAGAGQSINPKDRYSLTLAAHKGGQGYPNYFLLKKSQSANFDFINLSFKWAA